MAACLHEGFDVELETSPLAKTIRYSSVFVKNNFAGSCFGNKKARRSLRMPGSGGDAGCGYRLPMQNA